MYKSPLFKKELLKEAQKYALPFLAENYRIVVFSEIEEGFVYVLRHINGNRIAVTAVNQHVFIYKNNKLLKDVQMRKY